MLFDDNKKARQVRVFLFTGSIVKNQLFNGSLRMIGAFN